MNDRIREIRKVLGLTQESFGKTLGVKKSAISQIENGVNNLSDQMIKAICREFSVNEDWLRDGTGKPFVVPEDETAAIVTDVLIDPENKFYNLVLNILKSYSQLTPDEKHVIDELSGKIKENLKKIDNGETS